MQSSGGLNRSRNNNINIVSSSTLNNSVDDTTNNRSLSPPQLIAVREKEVKLEKDFMRLLSRYNHSKDLIDSLVSPHRSLKPSVDRRGPLLPIVSDTGRRGSSGSMVSPQKSFTEDSMRNQSFDNEEEQMY